MASSICDLYRCRWGIETFFKEIKQTLQIRTFVGFSRNAIEWQIFTLMKGALWARRSVSLIVSRYGTAGESPPERQAQLTPDLPGINWATVL